MEKTGKNLTDELLNVDLDAVVEKGKQIGKQKKKKIAVVVTIGTIFFIGIVTLSFWIHARNVESLYQQAISELKSGSYEHAYSLFQQTDEYRDSRTYMEYLEIAIDFTTSTLYSDMEKTVLDELLEIDPGATFDYQVETQSVLVEKHALTILTEDLENISPEIFASWVSVCETADEMASKWYSVLIDHDYSINFSVKVLDDSGENLLYQTVNGKSTFNYVDIDSAEPKMYEAVYEQIASYIEEEDYTGAVQYWNTLNDFYSKEYKDLHELINGAMYSYVSLNKNVEDVTTYNCLVKLKSEGFRDSGDIYAALYRFDIDLFFDDYELCYVITGGPPKGTVTVRIVNEAYWRNGSRSRREIAEDYTFTSSSEDKGIVQKREVSLWYAYQHTITAYDGITGEKLAQIVDPYE